MKITSIEITATYKGIEWCVVWRSDKTGTISWVNPNTFERGIAEWSMYRFVGNKSMAATQIRKAYKQFILNKEL